MSEAEIIPFIPKPFNKPRPHLDAALGGLTKPRSYFEEVMFEGIAAFRVAEHISQHQKKDAVTGYLQQTIKVLEKLAAELSKHMEGGAA